MERFTYYYQKIIFWFNKKRIYRILKRGIRTTTSKEVMLIDKGQTIYPYFSALFAQNMLSSALWCLAHGYLPYINLKQRDKRYANFDSYFEQPFVKKNIEPEITKICPLDRIYVTYNFDMAYDPEKLKLWSNAVLDFFILNKTTKDYIDNEYNTIFPKGHKVLGVLMRGSDYEKLKPKKHYVQPTIEQVIEEIQYASKKFGYEYIYMATEEEKYVTKLKEYFGQDKILVNKRNYYGELYRENNATWILEVSHERENDIYLKGLEYLSSLYLLSKCDSLVAGNCGGSLFALLLNNLKYQYVKMFNLGYYE